MYDVLNKGLDDLMEMCDVVTEKFVAAKAAKRDEMQVD